MLSQNSLLQTVIREDGVAIVDPTGGMSDCLMTIGNTEYDLPELFMFIDPSRVLLFSDFLRSLSRKMQRRKWVPPLLQRHAHEKITFTTMKTDRCFVTLYGAGVIQCYGHEPIALLQVMTTDQNHKFPYELEYDQGYLFQPLLKLH